MKSVISEFDASRSALVSLRRFSSVSVLLRRCSSTSFWDPFERIGVRFAFDRFAETKQRCGGGGKISANLPETSPPPFDLQNTISALIDVFSQSEETCLRLNRCKFCDSKDYIIFVTSKCRCLCNNSLSVSLGRGRPQASVSLAILLRRSI